jgi:multiple sugar transport system ATP-binding protein
MAGVRIRGLVKKFGPLEVIPPLDLTIEDREFLVLVGPSGCGKSTLLRIIAGLERADAGEIHIGNRLVNQLSPAERDVAMVFQDYALYPHMSVRKNMAFGLEMRRVKQAEIDARIIRAARMLHIEPFLDRKPKALSGGQRQRVAMGRAIVRDPQMFLFDEPLSNLDAQLRGQVRAEIKALSQQLRTTMVFVTHDQVEAMTMADRLVVLRSGVVQQVGTPEEIYEFPANRFVAGFIGSPPMNFFPIIVDADVATLADGTRLTLPSGAWPTRAVLGLRPEAMAHADEAADAISVRVALVEPLGSDTLVHFRLGAQDYVARLPPHPRPRLGERLRLAAPAGKMHLFDETGAALAPPRRPMPE